MVKHRSLVGQLSHASLVTALAAVTLLAATPVQAAPETYNVDPEHTAVTFSIRHLFSKVPGRFSTFSGIVQIDESQLEHGSVEFTIETASIDTNEPARDRHLRSDAFFDADNHPQITFRSTKVRKTGEDKLEVDGELSIRGISKTVTLDVEVLGFGELYGVRRAAFEIRTRIDRHDFKVSWNDVVEGGGLILGDDVDILINLEAKKAAR
jgi:polyisoprenoid-binding protein YceI